MITAVYRIADGEIVSVAHGVVPRDMPGCKTLGVASSLIDPKRHKVDLASLTIVDKTAAEIALAALPTLAEVKNIIVRQLHATDAFMMPDRPMTTSALAEWKIYRKALRDLSKGKPPPSIAGMIKAFPKRPDGVDAAATLRARLASKGKQR